MANEVMTRVNHTEYMKLIDRNKALEKENAVLKAELKKAKVKTEAKAETKAETKKVEKKEEKKGVTNND